MEGVNGAKAVADVVRVDVVATLREVRKGMLLHELSTAIESLTQAVREHKKKGSIVVKLEMGPVNPGEGSLVQIQDDVTVKLPRASRSKTLFFTTRDNTLARNDPRQRDFLREGEERAEG